MKNRIMVVLTAACFLGISLWNIVCETPDYSDSERRVLAKLPDLSIETVLDGEFSKKFDEYAVERFVVRDFWRSAAAYTKTKVLFQKDYHDLYMTNKHLSKMEYPMSTEMIDYAISVFDNVREQYLDDQKVYVAVIPDKNHYLAEESGHLELDYPAFSQYVAKHMEDSVSIEIADLLDAEDYYYTDTHWRQEQIIDVAEYIAQSMGSKISGEYKEHLLEQPFYGVYVGQSAMHCQADEMVYLTNEVIDQAEVTGADAVYDMKKAKGKDPYEMFLSGNQPIVTLENTINDTGKRLILFRDSFGSSIAPLLLEGYAEIVLVDLRYISSNQLGEYVSFENADVLFLYSTMLLNNSRSLR